MRTPPLLMAATLLFWGWQTELIHFAVIMGLVLEGSRLIRTRWEFSETDYRRIWNLCTILFLCATVYSFVSNDGTAGITNLFGAGPAAARSESLTKTTRSVLVLLQWFPLIFFPIVAVQAYSHQPTIDARIFSWLLRRWHLSEPSPIPPPAINVSFPFFVICLLATSTARNEKTGFYGGLALLLAWALWSQRNRRFSPVSWAAQFLLVVALGYGAHVGLNHLQKLVQAFDTAWLSRFSRQDFEGNGSRTALGSIGRLKLSGRIVLRVEPETRPVPDLLREASFNRFNSPLWYSSRKSFERIIEEEDQTTWKLLPGKESTRAVKISRYLNGGRGLLSLPNGVSQIEQLPVFSMKTNTMGVLKVEEGPGLVSYRALYDAGTTIDSPPDLEDKEVPYAEQPAVARIVRQLGLASKTPSGALAALSAFFQDKFQYSTYRGPEDRTPEGQTALSDFLLNRRAGHCEYFATATVLLLRSAGIPARYAVGYSVQERSGGNYVVRERHAHSWCLVFLDGAWQDFDTTPASWNLAEAERASFWEPVLDLWSDLWFAFSRWRWSGPSLRGYLLWLVLPALLVVLARLIFKRQWNRFRSPRPAELKSSPRRGVDSEFYRVQDRFSAWGLERQPGEPLSAWITRAKALAVDRPEELDGILALHYRYRFDPKGLGEEERSALARAVQSWLERNPVARVHPVHS